MLLVSCSVFAAKNISFDAPTEYTDGSPLLLSEIKEYHVFGANVSGGPYTIDQLIATIPGGDTTAIINVAGGVPWFFVLRTVLHNGLQSANSNEKEIPASLPNPPGRVIVVEVKVTLGIQ